MPELDLKLEYPDDYFVVNATMLFPIDDELRAAAINRQRMGEDLNYISELGELILDLPDRERLRGAAERSAYQGYVAGEVLYFLYELHRAGVEDASLGMAKRMAQKNLSHKLKSATGKVQTLRERGMFEIWRKYSPCAHFWAAKALNHHFHHIPPDEMFSEKYFYDFLGLAATLQEFATSFKSPVISTSDGMPLSREKIWTIPTSIPRREPATIKMPSEFFKMARAR